MAHEALTTFVQNNYTANGVSVASRGAYNVTLEIPADFVGLTDLLVSLHDLFGGTCDINTVTNTTLLTVWLPDERLNPSKILTNRVVGAMCIMCAILVAISFYFAYY